MALFKQSLVRLEADDLPRVEGGGPGLLFQHLIERGAIQAAPTHENHALLFCLVGDGKIGVPRQEQINLNEIICEYSRCHRRRKHHSCHRRRCRT
jgi:hypothetical protein